jgi:hypothetical protein
LFGRARRHHQLRAAAGDDAVGFWKHESRLLAGIFRYFCLEKAVDTGV